MGAGISVGVGTWGKNKAASMQIVRLNSHINNYPARACASKGLCDRSISTKKFQNFLNLSKYSLSEVHSNTGRLLIEFNCLQYTLAAPEVFVAFANPVCLPSWYRVSIVRNTNIDRSKPHPYGIIDTVEHAYSTILSAVLLLLAS